MYMWLLVSGYHTNLNVLCMQVAMRLMETEKLDKDDMVELLGMYVNVAAP